MASDCAIPCSMNGMPLDSARTAFRWLVTGPDPVSINGGLFAGLPARAVPLDELRDHLLHRGCAQQVRDAVWAHLVMRSRTEGGAWTVGCVGVALPALTRITAMLSARFAGDPRDIHSAVLTGFLSELRRVDLDRPRIMLRLRWAAYRGGHACVRDALDAPTPIGDGREPATPHTPPHPVSVMAAMPGTPPGHPDLVLARAVAAGVVTAAEAELIAATRLDGMPLADVALERGMSYAAVRKARRRAELRLAGHLHATTGTSARPRLAGPGKTDRRGSDPARVSNSSTPTDGMRSPSAASTGTAAVAGASRREVSPDASRAGVQTRETAPKPSFPLTPAGRPQQPAGPTTEMPRCA